VGHSHETEEGGERSEREETHTKKGGKETKNKKKLLKVKGKELGKEGHFCRTNDWKRVSPPAQMGQIGQHGVKIEGKNYVRKKTGTSTMFSYQEE